MDYFRFLPFEIIVDILSRLPAESALDCKLVCSNWTSLIRQPSFSKMHLHHLNHLFHCATADSGKLAFIASTADEKLHYFEYNDDENHEKPIQRIRKISFTPPCMNFRFVNSCNGLICLTGGWQSVCICNPITKEFVMLPEIKGDWLNDDRGDKDFYWMTGFCFVSSTNEYKVVRVYVGTKPWKVQIYTLGSGNGWRDLGDLNSTFNSYHVNEAGILANGALYWMNDKLKMIGAFDLVEEKFSQHFSPPPLPLRSDWYYCGMRVLDGYLYFTNYLEGQFKDVWLLTTKNNNHGMKERGEHQSLGWSKEFTVHKGEELLAVTKSDGFLTYNWNCLNYYDTKASTSKKLVDFKERIRTVIPHKNTLVSLKELGEKDTRTMESVERQSSYKRMRCEP